MVRGYTVEECSLEVTCAFRNRRDSLGETQCTVVPFSLASMASGISGRAFITCMLVFATASALLGARVLSLLCPGSPIAITPTLVLGAALSWSVDCI